ncbi:MAG TPA: hypothetical protein VKN14_12970, partial [Flavobacteriaceae bacterium]|nr:hypothetical protein [Flavobacteriaceae bacterium]
QPSETAIALEEATSSTTEDEVEKLKEEIKELKEESAQAQKVPVVLVETPAVVSQQEDKVVTEEPVKEPTVTSNLLYAQAIDNGFQLVDSTPKVVYKIQRTSLANVYLIEGRNAILYKNGDDWILEYYEDNVLKKEQLPVKF